jgi:hypothetical protein
MKCVTVIVAVSVVLALATFGNVTHIRIVYVYVSLAKGAKGAKESTITESFDINIC